MIEATIKNKDAKEICNILKDSHLEKIKPKGKLDHGRLKCIMNYGFFNIRKEYDVKEKENKEEGRVDFIYYPKNKKKKKSNCYNRIKCK